MILLAAAVSTTLCLAAEDREAVRAIMLEGLDAALKQHTMHLYDNMLKDREEQPPDRMVRGMQNGIRLYARSRDGLLKWSPPMCKG